ncbi:hypothetical protein ACTJIL_03895 [Luteimonas sp. 22616]|uniref:hypothetical protein n=1 Tax=Luteimonas sp. 22616 TaxID=3453951 RepID=UPI003F838AAA
MVKIDEVQAGYIVKATGYTQLFRNKLKAILAAHAMALAEAVEVGGPVEITFPEGWGDPVVVYEPDF